MPNNTIHEQTVGENRGVRMEKTGTIPYGRYNPFNQNQSDATSIIWCNL